MPGPTPPSQPLSRIPFSNGATTETVLSPQLHLTIEERLGLPTRQATPVLELPHVTISEHGRQFVELVAFEAPEREPSRHSVAERYGDCWVEGVHRDRLPVLAWGERRQNHHDLARRRYDGRRPGPTRRRGGPEPLDLRLSPRRGLAERAVRRERCVAVVAPSNAFQLQAVLSTRPRNADAAKPQKPPTRRWTGAPTPSAS